MFLVGREGRAGLQGAGLAQALRFWCPGDEGKDGLPFPCSFLPSSDCHEQLKAQLLPRTPTMGYT